MTFLANRVFGDNDFGTAAELLDTGARTGSVEVRDASGLKVWFGGGLPVIPEASPARTLSLGLKRAIDIIAGSMALFALAPLLVAVVILIRATSSGPALFRQQRDGLNGRAISVYKFRSMYVDQGDASGVAQTRKGDARITPVGHFIRRWSIDELPQLLNVILGDMSLIGPRPHPINMLAAGVPYGQLVPYYHARHAMKPGISGWAQANGLRGPTENRDVAVARINHDIGYIQNYSILLDLKIMLRTLQRELLPGTGF